MLMRSIFLPSKATAAAGIALAISAVSATVNRVEPIPITEWPAWAKELTGYREPADTGLGDTVVHVIGDTRSEKFKAWFEEKLGKSCGCIERQRWLNARYPYPKTDAAASLQPS
jgi:hypothetical protein